MSRIQQLSPRLANQIAAGEVVERPASVVKELLENSLDADADRIDIQLKGGGSQLIEISDNGTGIHEADLCLSLSRHATSKISALTDLEQVCSLGFRGEALASISSVSRLCLTSKTADQDAAFQVMAEGREMSTTVKPAARPNGTTVSVRDLFFNTPARRKFLRSERTELQHIEAVIKRIALSRFDCAFHCQHADRVLLKLPIASNSAARSKRVAKICGHGFISQALELDTESNDLRLWGWVADSNFSRSQADLQYFYVNGRVIRDKLINHAIRQAYADYLPEGRYCAYVLFLELEPNKVDVNVHPTKHEVRFREARLIHDFILRSLQTALQSETTLQIEAPQPSLELESAVAITSDYQRPLQQASQTWQVQQQTTQYQHLLQSAKTEDDIVLSKAKLSKPDASKQKILGRAKAQLGERYLLAENQQGLVLVDLLIAWRQIQAAKLQKNAATDTITKQTLLVPVSLKLTSVQQAAIQQEMATLTQLGFDISVSGEQSIWVRQAPSLLQNADFSALIPALLDQLSTTEQYDKLTLLSSLLQYCSPNLSTLSLLDMEQYLRQIEIYTLDSEILSYRILSFSDLAEWMNDA